MALARRGDHKSVARLPPAGVVAVLALSPDNWRRYLFGNGSHALRLSEHFLRTVTLFYCWFSEPAAFLGDSLAPTDFLVCLRAATLPLLAALWLFHRKAY